MASWCATQPMTPPVKSTTMSKVIALVLDASDMSILFRGWGSERGTFLRLGTPRSRRVHNRAGVGRRATGDERGATIRSSDEDVLQICRGLARQGEQEGGQGRDHDRSGNASASPRCQKVPKQRRHRRGIDVAQDARDE